MTRLTTINRQSWTKDVSAALQGTRPDKAAEALKPLIAKLKASDIPPEERAALFESAAMTTGVDAGVLKAALAKLAEDAGVHVSAAGLFAAINAVVNTPVPAADVASRVELKAMKTPGGAKLEVGVGRMEDVPADYVGIPQHISSQFGRGGVAKAYTEAAARLNETPGGQQYNLKAQLDDFDNARTEAGGTIRSGTTRLAETPVNDAALFPGVLAHVGSVPPQELEPRMGYATPQEKTAHLSARRDFAKSVMEEWFDAVADDIVAKGKKNTVVLMPAWNTGPKGALGDGPEGFGMSGELIAQQMDRILRKADRGGKFEVLKSITYRVVLSNSDPTNTATNRDAFMAAAKTGRSSAEGVTAYQPPHEKMSTLMKGYGAEGRGGVAVDTAYVGKRMTDAKGPLADFTKAISSMDAKTIADLSKATADPKLANRAHAEMFWQLHRFLEQPELNGGKPGDAPKPVTKERMMALLADPAIQELVTNTITKELGGAGRAKDGFDGKMNEVLPYAIAGALREKRMRFMENAASTHNAQMASLNKEIETLRAKVARGIDPTAYEQLVQKHRESVDTALKANQVSNQLDLANAQLKQQLRKAMDIAATAEERAARTPALEREISRLTDRLADALASARATEREYSSRPVAVSYARTSS